MYASLAAAGASALYDLYKSVTGSSKTTDTSSTASAFPSTTSASSSVGATTATSTVGAVGSADTGRSKFSDALNKLFTDLQASTSASATDANSTSTIADDLQSISKGLNSAGKHGPHRHGPKAVGSADPATPDGAATSASNPFQGLASSLVAYAKTQSLGASASTSLTA